MNVYIIRHGEREDRAANTLYMGGNDPALTAEGLQQAQLTGNKLRGAGIDFVLSSPFQRTVETAVEIAAVLGLEVGVENGLSEVLLESMYTCDPLTPNYAKRRRPEWLAAYISDTYSSAHEMPRYPEVESAAVHRCLNTFYMLIVNCVKAKMKKRRPKGYHCEPTPPLNSRRTVNIVVVTHAFVTETIARHLVSYSASSHRGAHSFEAHSVTGSGGALSVLNSTSVTSMKDSLLSVPAVAAPQIPTCSICHFSIDSLGSFVNDPPPNCSLSSFKWTVHELCDVAHLHSAPAQRVRKQQRHPSIATASDLHDSASCPRTPQKGDAKDALGVRRLHKKMRTLTESQPIERIIQLSQTEVKKKCSDLNIAVRRHEELIKKQSLLILRRNLQVSKTAQVMVGCAPLFTRICGFLESFEIKSVNNSCKSFAFCLGNERFAPHVRMCLKKLQRGADHPPLPPPSTTPHSERLTAQYTSASFSQYHLDDSSQPLLKSSKSSSDPPPSQRGNLVYSAAPDRPQARTTSHSSDTGSPHPVAIPLLLRLDVSDESSEVSRDAADFTPKRERLSRTPTRPKPRPAELRDVLPSGFHVSPPGIMREAELNVASLPRAKSRMSGMGSETKVRPLREYLPQERKVRTDLFGGASPEQGGGGGGGGSGSAPSTIEMIVNSDNLSRCPRWDDSVGCALWRDSVVPAPRTSPTSADLQPGIPQPTLQQRLAERIHRSVLSP